MSDHQSMTLHAITTTVLESHKAPVPALLQHEADVEHITVLAHDLRNYLTPVSAQLAMLYGRAQQEHRESDMRAAARGRRALDYALLLIANVLDAARMDYGVFDLSPEPLNLSVLVEQAAEIFETSQSAIILCVPEVVMVRADRERLRQVLHNLLANALTYSPRGTPVMIDLRIEQRDNGTQTVLLIRNSGPAIPASVLPQIFQRFATGSASHGLGLGLYLARGTAEAHDGTLTVHSDDNTGTCFRLTLPLDRSSANIC